MKNKKMTIEIELERTFDPKRRKNTVMFYMEAITFYEDEQKKKKVGSICHGVPCNVLIFDKKTGETWTLSDKKLFETYMEAREKL